MSIRSALYSPLPSKIDSVEIDIPALPLSSVEPASVEGAPPICPSKPPSTSSSTVSRTVTKESLHDGTKEANKGQVPLGPPETDLTYRITPPPSGGRESPLLFAASFDRTDASIITPLPPPPTIGTSIKMSSSQPPKIEPPKPLKSLPPAPLPPPKPPVLTNKPTHPPSLIHHPPNISIPRPVKPPTTSQSTDSPTSENTGRWTAEEHRLFLQGLEEHGKGWKKIASLIQTRTVVQIRTHAQKYFQKLAKARANGEVVEEEKIPMGVVMRTVPPGNMALGTDSVSRAAAAGAIGTGSVPAPRKRRGTSVGTKRRAIGSAVRSSVREGRNYKRQKVLEGKKKGDEKSVVANPLPSISNILDPYVMAPPVLGVAVSQEGGEGAVAKKKSRGRQQLVQTATHGTLPMAALEDAVFRLLTPAPGATGQTSASAQQPPAQNPSIVDPLAPNPVKISAPYPQVAAAGAVPNSSPTCVTDLSGFPSWVDAKNPPTWYNNGEDIDKLLEDAEDLNWLCDTGDLDETYPPAVAATAAAVANEPAMDFEPTPVNVHSYEYAYHGDQLDSTAESMDPTLVHNPMVHPSVESLSFLVDSPKEDLDEMPSFLEEQPALPYAETSVETQDLPMEGQLMSFPDLDMGDEQAFVSALLDTSKESALSFSKWGSQNGVAELGEEEVGGDDAL